MTTGKTTSVAAVPAEVGRSHLPYCVVHAHVTQTAYEAITLSAFLLLLMELVALRTSDNDIMNILKAKDKKKLP